MTTRIEADVEQAVRDRLEGLDWRVVPRQEPSPDAPAAGRVYGMPCTLGSLSASRGQPQSGRVREVKQ